MDISKSEFVDNIGGVFIYSDKPKELAEWYARHFGFDFETFENEVFTRCFFYHPMDSNRKTYVAWAIMKNPAGGTPHQKGVRINYRVRNLDAMIAHLETTGTVIDTVKEYPEGKFAWMMDPEGNPIELWEDTNLS